MTKKQFKKLKEGDLIEFKITPGGRPARYYGKVYRAKILIKYPILENVKVADYDDDISYQYIELAKIMKKPKYLENKSELLIFQWIKKFIKNFKK